MVTRAISRPAILVFVAAVVGLSAVLALMRFNSFQVGAFQDDAYYIILAESLAGGHGFRLINFPFEFFEWSKPAGFPALLVPLVALFPGNYTVLQAFSLICWLATIPLVYQLFSFRLKRPWLVGLVVLVALNPAMVGIATMVMSEAAYLLVTLGSLAALQAWERQKNFSEQASRTWLLVLALALAVAGQLIRTIGFALLLAYALYFLHKRYWRAEVLTAVAFAIGLVPQAALAMQRGGSLISPGYEVYVITGQPLADKPGQIIENFLGYTVDGVASGLLLPIFGGTLASFLDRSQAGLLLSLVNFGLLVLVVLGFVLALRQINVAELYVFLSILVVLPHWDPNIGGTQARFLIPLLPFLYFYLLHGLAWLLERDAFSGVRRFARPAAIALFALVLAVFFFRHYQDWRFPVRSRITDLAVGSSWVRDHVEQEAVVLVPDPVPRYLYLRRKTVYPKTADHVRDVEQYLKQSRVDYVLIAPSLQSGDTMSYDEFAQAKLIPFIRAHPTAFQQVYADPTRKVLVFRVAFLQ